MVVGIGAGNKSARHCRTNGRLLYLLSSSEVAFIISNIRGNVPTAGTKEAIRWMDETWIIFRELALSANYYFSCLPLFLVGELNDRLERGTMIDASFRYVVLSHAKKYSLVVAYSWKLRNRSSKVISLFFFNLIKGYLTPAENYIFRNACRDESVEKHFKKCRMHVLEIMEDTQYKWTNLKIFLIYWVLV